MEFINTYVENPSAMPGDEVVVHCTIHDEENDIYDIEFNLVDSNYYKLANSISLTSSEKLNDDNLELHFTIINNNRNSSLVYLAKVNDEYSTDERIVYDEDGFPAGSEILPYYFNPGDWTEPPAVEIIKYNLNIYYIPPEVSLQIKSDIIGIGKTPDLTINNSIQIQEGWRVEGFYPVGSLFFSINSTNPKYYFGGTWELFNPGKTVVGVDEDNTNFSTSQLTGGEATHQLTISEIPSHTHQYRNFINEKSGTDYARMRAWGISGTAGYPNSYVGGDVPHENMQPYVTCYIWIRTA